MLLVTVAATLPLEKPLQCIDHTPSSAGQSKTAVFDLVILCWNVKCLLLIQNVGCWCHSNLSCSIV